MEVKVVKIIVVVIGVFVFCWVLFFIFSIVFMYKKEFFFIFVFKCVKWLEYLNSCLNFVLYICLNKIYRKVFKRFFRWWCGKLECFCEELVVVIGILFRWFILLRGFIFFF